MKTGSVVIFGTGNFASLAWYCLTHDSHLRVEAFTVDRPFISRSRQGHLGLPIVPFDELEKNYPPSQIDLFIPLGYQLINGLRKERFLQAKARGYRFASYVSSHASVWPDLKMGENCMIHEHAKIDAGVCLGDDVVVRNGAHIGHDGRIGAHGFVASQAVLGPRVQMGARAFVGVGAVVREGVLLGERCFIGTGSVLLGAADADGVYLGNPARKTEKISSLEATGGGHDTPRAA
jgi:sugar O-acyltransferase (sialic acid O-acetyltransferase NeuD family)